MKRALLAIAAVLVSDGALGAQDVARPVVEVTCSGEPALLEAMADRIRSLQARYPVAIRWTAAAAIDVREIVAPRAGAEPVFARVWLDMSDPRRALLFIANAGHDRFLVRVVPASDGYGELTRESLVTVVESALDALLAGGEIGVDRSAAVRELEAQTGTPIAAEPKRPEPAAAEPASAPVPAPAGPRSTRGTTRQLWSLALQYRADAIASGLTLRHGAQLALAYAAGFEGAVDLLLVLTTQYAPAFSLGDGGRRVEAFGGGARIAAGATSEVSRVFGWQTALGAGADLARVEPAIDADTGLVGAQPFLAVSPIATLFVTGTIHPARWFDLALGVGLDVALLDQHFDVESAGDRTPVIAPWRARPYAFMGVGVPFGEGRPR